MKEVVIDFSVIGSLRMEVIDSTEEEVNERIQNMTDSELFHAIANDGTGMDGDQITIETIYDIPDKEGNMKELYSARTEILNTHFKYHKQVIDRLLGIANDYESFLDLFEDEDTVSKKKALDESMQEINAVLNALK